MFGSKLQNKFTVTLIVFQLIIVSFFTSFGVIGWIKKDFGCYCFDEDYEQVAYIMLIAGIIGGVWCLWWSIQITKNYEHVTTIPSEKLPPVQPATKPT